jgi:multiple sugar transport system substrate-binding protein
MKRNLIAAILAGLFCISVFSGCGNEKKVTSEQNTSANNEVVTIRTTIQPSELSADLIKDFESQNKNIKVELVGADDTKLMAMIAAGTAPDVIRIRGAYETPSYVTRGLALNLDKYFEKSTMIKKDDLLPVANVYRWDGKNQGQGSFYGLPKDFSPDMGLWINKKLFQEAGIPIPDPKKPLTYEKIMEYSKKLTKKDSTGKFTVYGFAPGEGIYNTLTSMAYAQLNNTTLFTDGFNKPNFSSNENKKIMQWFVDFVKSESCVSPLVTMPDWYGPLFAKGQIGIVQTGYWYSGTLRGDENSKTHLEDFMYLPAPQWTEGQKRYSPVAAATGVIILRQSKHPDEAFKFFEYFTAGKPSEERAKSGWGLPIWKSKLNLVPQSTAFDKQSFDVVQDEINYMGDVLQYNPFLYPTAVNALIDKIVVPVYFGKETVDNAAKKLDAEVLKLINEGKEIAGVK